MNATTNSVERFRVKPIAAHVLASHDLWLDSIRKNWRNNNAWAIVKSGEVRLSPQSTDTPVASLLVVRSATLAIHIPSKAADEHVVQFAGVTSHLQCS